MSRLLSSVRRFLRKLGQEDAPAQQPFMCPCHRHIDPSLWVSYTRDGHVLFRCTIPGCNFTGVAPEIVSRVRDIQMSEALTLFNYGAEFYDPVIFHPPVGGVTRHESLNAERAAGVAKALQRTQENLMTNGLSLQARLEQHGIDRETLIQYKAGMLSYGIIFPGIPALRHRRYRNDNTWLVLPFFNRGELTHLTLYSPELGECSRIPTSTIKLHGLLFERELPWPSPESVVVCFGEIESLTLLTKLRYLGLDSKFSVVCPSGPLSFDHLQTLREICFLSTPWHPLKLDKAVSYLQRYPSLELKVVELAQPLGDYPSREFVTLNSKAKPLQQWLLPCIREHMASNEPFHLSGDMCDFLVNNLSSTEEEANDVIEQLQNTTCRHTERSFDDTVIQRRPDGFWQLEPRVKKLTNVSIYVESWRTLPDGTNAADLIVYTSSDEPPVSVTVPFNVLRHDKASKLGDYIWEKLLGQNNYKISIKRPYGVNWLTVLRHFDDAPYVVGTRKLGVVNASLFLPKFSVDFNDLSLTPAEAPKNVDNNAVHMYAGLHVSTVDPKECAELWSSHSIQECVAAGTISHVVQEMLSSVRDGADYRPTHLIFPTTADHLPVWSEARKSAYQVFSGRREPIAITAPRQLGRMKKIVKHLGTLPLFCTVSDVMCNCFVEWVETINCPVIASVGPLTAVNMNKRCQCNFVSPQPMIVGMTSDDVREDLLVKLSAALPTLLHKIAIAYSLDQDGGISALTGNWKITALLGVEPNPASVMMFRPSLTVNVLNGAERFLLLLWELIQENNDVILGTPTDWYKGAPGKTVVASTTAEGCILVSHSAALEAVNTLKGGDFEELQLTEDMSNRHWIVHTDRWPRKKRWVVKEQVWDYITQDRGPKAELPLLASAGS